MSKAKPKRPSDETPVLHCIVENGRLVPAFPYDAERLASFNNGTKVYVWMSTDNGSRRLVRKWWAIINWYVKNTELIWSDSESASNAIKLALNMVSTIKTARGVWFAYPRSLTEINDTALSRNILKMQDLLTQMTGVDQETARREGNNEGDGFPDEPDEIEEHQSPDEASPPPASGEDAGAAPATIESGASAPEPEAEPAPVGDTPNEPDDAWINREWLLALARQLVSATDVGEQMLVNNIANALAKEVPARVTTDTRQDAKKIRDLCKEVCFQTRKRPEVVQEIATMLNVGVEDIDIPPPEKKK